MNRYLIRGSRIYDGSGNVPYSADVLTEGERIARIGIGLPEDGAEVIDGTGMILTPGFIDTHRHCDLAALYDPQFGRLELAQGLTSVVAGNCGLGIVPVTDEHRMELYDYVEPCLGSPPTVCNPVSYRGYMDALAGTDRSIHMGSYLPTGAVKAAVKGYGRERFTAKEMDWACGYIREGLEAGALGLSMGIMYQPECYSSREEMIKLLSAAAPCGRVLSCHIRGEGDNLLPSVSEIIGICREAELPLNISHFKSVGVKNWGNAIHRAIELVEEARGRGQDVSVDAYPYCGGSTTLISLIPPTVLTGSIRDLLELLRTKPGKDCLKKELYREHGGWDNMVTAIGWERILISSASSQTFDGITGCSFVKAASRLGYQDPCDLMADMLVEEDGKVGIVVLSMDQGDVDTVMHLPYSMVISDSLYGNGGSPHPRLYGSFPKIIREYVLERGVLTMEEAIKKMTWMPARRLNLKERGLIREGYFADLNLFDPSKVRDRATYEISVQLSTGITCTWVDGQPADLDKERCGIRDASVMQLHQVE